MASYGFNARATSGYVTDPAGTTYTLGAIYPETRNGITFGFTVANTGGARDRNSGNDARLAGVNFVSATQEVFQVDLPASGSWDIGIAQGDPSSAAGVQYVEIFDNTTSLWSSTGSSIGSANSFSDITGAVYTQANFFANQTLKTLTFSTTTLKVQIGKSGVGGSNKFISHLYINQSGGGGVTGSAAWTEASDTWSGSGAVAVSGTAAWTEVKDGWAGTGGIVATGTVSWTEASDTWSASGTVTTGPSGSVAWTEAADIWAGAGAVAIAGTASWTEVKDTWAVTGSITLPGISGSVAWTEGQDIWAGLGSNGLIWTPVTPVSTLWTPVIPGSNPWTPV